MFDPSHQLHDYFVGQGYSDLEAYREANLISGRCPIGWRAHKQPDRTSVKVPQNTMETPETQQETPDSEIIDFGFDVNEADVARPILKAGRYDATIRFARRENSNKKGLPQLLVGYALIHPTTDIKGKEVRTGFIINQRILLQPTGKLTQQQIDDRVKRIHFAAAGAGRVNSQAWIGKAVQVRVSLREPHRDETTGEEYDASNEIAAVLPLAVSTGTSA